VLERYALCHALSSSRGPSKAIRHEYGDDELYTRMVARSLRLWQELATITGQELYVQTGVLTLGHVDDGYTLPSLKTMRSLGLPVSRLSIDRCSTLFPQFMCDDYDAITYNEVGGFLTASKCVVALAGRLLKLGGKLRESSLVAALDLNGPRPAVRLNGGGVLAADRLVVAAGPWVQDLVGDLQLPVTPTRQQVTYISGVPASAFGPDKFPVFLIDRRYYGFPIHDSAWFKVASHRAGETADPNSPYPVDDSDADDCLSFLRRTIPIASLGKVAAVDRCMYDMTPDEDFILDRHPASDRVVIATGFSGHGFKFGPLLGRLIAALMLSEETEFPLDRFRMDRFPGPIPTILPHG